MFTQLEHMEWLIEALAVCQDQHDKCVRRMAIETDHNTLVDLIRERDEWDALYAEYAREWTEVASRK